jgi:hypothetical protein
MILPLEPVALGCLVDAGLVATFPGAVVDIPRRFRRMGARLDPDPVEELGIYTHQS